MDNKTEVKTEAKQMAVCAGMFPKTSQPFANKMAKDLKVAKFDAEVQQAKDPGYVRVAVKAKDETEAKKTLEAMKKAGFSGFVFEF